MSDKKHTTLPAVLSTAEAAAAINRQPQTLRKWACLENGPIRPIRINGRLAWPVEELSRLWAGGDYPKKSASGPTGTLMQRSLVVPAAQSPRLNLCDAMPANGNGGMERLQCDIAAEAK